MAPDELTRVTLDTNEPKGCLPAGVEQILVSFVLLLLGGFFCLIPLLFGFEFTTFYRGNSGPGGATALIIGIIFLLLGLVGLLIGVIKLITK